MWSAAASLVVRQCRYICLEGYKDRQRHSILSTMPLFVEILQELPPRHLGPASCSLTSGVSSSPSWSSHIFPYLRLRHIFQARHVLRHQTARAPFACRRAQTFRPPFLESRDTWLSTSPQQLARNSGLPKRDATIVARHLLLKEDFKVIGAECVQTCLE